MTVPELGWMTNQSTKFDLISLAMTFSFCPTNNKKNLFLEQSGHNHNNNNKIQKKSWELTKLSSQNLSITKFLLYIEEFLSDLNTMLSYPKWIQVHGPPLAEVVFHDPWWFWCGCTYVGDQMLFHIEKLYIYFMYISHIISYNHKYLGGHM